MVNLIRGPNIRWILLERPRGFSVIPLFKVFWPKWRRRNKGVPDEFVSIFESDTTLIEINNAIRRSLKEEGITQIPVSSNEKNLLDESGLRNPIKIRREKLVNKGFLIRNHIFIPFGGSKGREEVSPDDYDFL